MHQEEGMALHDGQALGHESGDVRLPRPLRGTARHVYQNTQLANASSVVFHGFQLQLAQPLPDGRAALAVEVSGVTLSGFVSEGDEVELDAWRIRDGVLQTDELRDLSTGVHVRAFRGVAGLQRTYEATMGRRTARLVLVAQVVVATLVVGWLGFIVYLIATH